MFFFLYVKTTPKLQTYLYGVVSGIEKEAEEHMETDSLSGMIKEAVEHVETDSVKANNNEEWSSHESNVGLINTNIITIAKSETQDSLFKVNSTLQPSFDRILKTGMEATNNPEEVSLMLEKKTRLRTSTLRLSDERNSEGKVILLDEDEIQSVVSETLCSSVIRASVGHSRKKLLILDINGLLADVVYHFPKDYTADKIIAGRAIFNRPFFLDFLRFCFERFEVGVWSSRTKKNVNSVIDYLMGDMKHKLLFCWDQSHCTASPFRTLENRHKPMVFKELRRIWEKFEPNLPWETGYYNESNTLLLDDSPYKALLNPPHTAVFPNSYTFQHRSDNSLGDGGDLRLYLEGLFIAKNVQNYVEQHPFGQSAISAESESWPFYHRVIGTMNSLPTMR